MEKAKSLTQGALSRVTGQPQEPNLWGEIEANICPSLSRTQRLYGFAICLAIGIIITFVGWLTLLTGNIAAFAVLYTVGNIIALCSSGFLVGPCKQVKNMFAPTRRIATCVYFVAMILTIIVAFATKKPALCIIMIVIQWAALVWYFLSYIPYGRRMVTNCCKTAVGV
eukprot:c5963_g1_i1.p1 GENE.c5963_g1_i1~~c5963_g1_i1.p1  ORF type:complete len:182 (-),score=22.51 c5963_g1_i1:256-759(-)